MPKNNSSSSSNSNSRVKTNISSPATNTSKGSSNSSASAAGVASNAGEYRARLKTLTGVLERITFHSEETGYTVARMLPDRALQAHANQSGQEQPQPDGQPKPKSTNNTNLAAPRSHATRGEDNLVAVVGNLLGAVAGEALELIGLWQQHHQHGWQFKIESYRSILPATEQGIRKYLGSGLIKGIGPKTADKIVAHFGLDTLDVLDNHPEKLVEVPKLGQHKARLISTAWVEQKAIKEVMVFLQSHGVSTTLAVKIYKQYGDASITIVKNEPYRLARELWGVGFRTADKIAQALGFATNDPERLKAGTLYVLSEASDSGGHTYLPRPLLREKAAELLGVTPDEVDQAITGLALDGGAQVETLALDEEDGSLVFQPLVAVTMFSTQAPAQTRGKTATLGDNLAGVAIPVPAPAEEEIDYLELELTEQIRYTSKAKPTATPVSPTSTPAAKTKANPRHVQATPAVPKTTNNAGNPSPLSPKPESQIAQAAAAAKGEVEATAGATLTLSALPGEQVVYLSPFYYAEQGVANHLLRLANCPKDKDKLTEFKKTDFTTMFDFLSTKDTAKLELADRQKEGVVMGLVRPVGVLTGGPGTGKTTSMRALIRVLTLKKKTVLLAAPTGRAAKRLSEATGLEAKTLHRLLELRPGGKSKYDYKDNPIPADIVIVDETSMLDTLLINTLLKGIATGTHLLLVGDADQLPSVGAGNVLADIINSEVVPVVRLDQIFRQGAGSAIVTNAHLINQGKMPVTGKAVSDFFFFQEDDPEKAGDLVVELVANRIPTRFGFKPEDIQVLAPMHKGKSGVGYLNEKLQEVLNPAVPPASVAPGATGSSSPPSSHASAAIAAPKPQKQYGNKIFRVGDKVMQLRNNYDKSVFNGDAGTITTLSMEDQSMSVNLEDGREVVYDFSELDELTLAYAVSIHKSQGSEYPACVIPVAMGHFMLLERKLIYTAITRAKKLVVLVGSRKALAMAVRNGPKLSDSGGNGEGKKDRSNSGQAQTPNQPHRAGRYTGLAIRLNQNRL